MSRISVIYIAIQNKLEMGYSPYIVAKQLGIPVEWVFEIEDELNNEMHEQE